MIDQLVTNEQSMESLGRNYADLMRGGDIIYLEGELGAGKTTFVRGFLRGLGHQGGVTSPTYTLIEPYSFESFSVYHLDLYRLESAEELETLGLRDMINDESILLVEWPDRGLGVLPPATVSVSIQYAADARNVAITLDENRSGI